KRFRAVENLTGGFAMRPLLVVMSLAVAAHAQRALTLDDALALGRAQSRDLQAARAHLDAAATSVTQAWAALLPTAAMQGKYTHNYKEIAFRPVADTGLLGLVEVIKATSGNAAQNGALNQYELAYTQAIQSAPAIILQKAEQLDFVVSVTLPL